MMNKQERSDFEKLQRERDYLAKQRDRLQDQLGRAQERLEDFQLLIDNVETGVARVLKEFKQKVTQLLTGTPPEDQI